MLEVRQLTVKDRRGIDQVRDLSLHVNAGEILAIAGVDGNGQAELVKPSPDWCGPKAGRC